MAAMTRQQSRKRRMSRQFTRMMSSMSMRRTSVASWQSFKTALSGWGSRRGSRMPDFALPPVTVTSVRDLLMAQLEDCETLDDDYDIRDLERMKISENFLQRFIDDAWKGMSKGARITDRQVVDVIVDVLKWRKDYGINDFKASDFPSDFFNAGIIKQGTLPSGDVMLYVIGRKYKKIDQWSEVIIDLVLWKFDEIELSLTDGQKILVFVDATGCGLSQADTGLMFKGIPILISYYPGAVAKAYIYQVPWLLKPFAQVAMALLPSKFKDLVCFVENKTGIAMMGEENVPDFMGGPIATMNFPCPEGTASVDAVGTERGINKSNIVKMQKMLDGVMKEK